MATVLSSLFNLLDSTSVNNIASRLGEPGHAVTRGLESTTASLVGGLAARSGDPTSMSQMFGMMSQAPADVNVGNLIGSVLGSGGMSSATSSLLDSGKRLLSLAFGNNQGSIVDGIARSAGLRGGSVMSLMSIAAPLLMSALGRMIRTDHMTQSQFAGWLTHEASGVQALLPAGIHRYIEETPPTPAPYDATARPMAMSAIPERQPGFPGWLWLIPALLIIPLLFWLLNRPHIRGTAQSAQTGMANLGNFVTRTLPDGVRLNIPQNGVESQLLGFIQSRRSPDQTTWFTFDRLWFDTDSVTLRPESQEQLRNIAEVMKAYPNVRLKVGGFTDNVGDPQYNLQLSKQRADAVVASLAALGVPSDRLESQGFGDQYPVADNSTEKGRAQNRRVAMQVTQK
ncbi:MAG TPA: OmpA family protein [Bryobacteraceae bacterium]|nr:OmpA family protein [Bryobacteraceae bacterium]